MLTGKNVLMNYTVMGLERCSPPKKFFKIKRSLKRVNSHLHKSATVDERNPLKRELLCFP